MIRRELPVDGFINKTYSSLVKVFYDQLDRGEPIRADRALDELKTNEARELLSQISVSTKEFDNPKIAATDCIRKVKFLALKEQIKNIKKERNEALRAGETERSRRLQQMIGEMQSSLNQVTHTAI